MSVIQKLASNLTLAQDLSPDSRDREAKGRFKATFQLIGSKPGKTLLLSLIGSIFFLPLIILLGFVLPQEITQLQNAVNISGGLGFGYASTSQAVINDLVNQIFDLKQKYVLCYVAPSCLIAGLGLSGVYNVLRNMIWEAKSRLFRDFFMGIKRHWYKFMVCFLVIGVIATGFAYSVLELVQSYSTQVTPNAIWWVLTIVLGLLAIIVAMYFMVLIPMFITYKFDNSAAKNISITMKNAGIIMLLSPIQTLFIVVLLAAPFALMFTSFGVVWLVLFALYGVSLYVIAHIHYSQFLTDSYIAYLYNRNIEIEKKAKEKPSKPKQNNAKKAPGYKRKKK